MSNIDMNKNSENGSRILENIKDRVLSDVDNGAGSKGLFSVNVD